MDINQVAQKLKDAVAGNNGFLNLPDDFPVKENGISTALNLLKISKLKVSVKQVDILVDGNVISIKDAMAQVAIFKVDNLNLAFQFKHLSDDAYSTEASFTFQKMSIPALGENGLIPLDKLPDASIFNPQQYFNEISATAESSSAQLTLEVTNSNNTLELFSSLGITISNYGFVIARTYDAFTRQTDTMFTLKGTLQLGKTAANIWVSVPVNRSSLKGKWGIGLTSKTSLTQGINDLGQLFFGTNIFNILPQAITDIGSHFGMQELSFYFYPATASAQSLQVKIGSTQPWDVIPGKFKIENAGAEFLIQWDKGKKNASTSIKGEYKFSNNIDFAVDLEIPSGNNDWEFNISLGIDNPPQITTLNDLNSAKIPGGLDINQFGLPDDWITFRDLNLNQFTITFNPKNKTAAVSSIVLDLDVGVQWTIVKNILEVSDPKLQLTVINPLNKNRIIYGSMGGSIEIVTIPLEIEVAKQDEQADWMLTLGTQTGRNYNLLDLVKQFISKDSTLPDEIFPNGLNITNIWLKSNLTRKPHTYQFHGETAGEWAFKFGELPEIKSSASVTFNYDRKEGEQQNALSGEITGTFKFTSFEMDVAYEFGKDNKQITIILWKQFKATYSATTSDGKPNKKLSIVIGDWSLGDLLAKMITLVNPAKKNYSLPDPWSLLNSISLKGLSFDIDLETKEVTVNYKLPKPIDFGILKIEGVSLTKEDGKMMVDISGTYLGGQKIPSWDAANQSPPEVPGQGNKYLDLRLLAMGQHVSLNSNEFTNIDDAVTKMQNAFKEPKENSVPVGGTNLLKFNNDSNWLIATNFGILNVAPKGKSPIYTVDLAVVFNDPELYGLRIQLNGDKVKVLKGLRFEIMYKKITDSIGLYQMELTLPDALRYLEFGAVSIVLPVIGIEIYTNGDFKVDIGFPYNLDFSRSFSAYAQIGPFPVMGSGGFYFGKLSGDTATQVPKTTKGSFNPVMVFGIGLQLGLGREINKGILKAGFGITIVGIIEGVIATYNSYAPKQLEEGNSQVNDQYYYWLRGQIGLLGKLYGTVNFGIIQASVNLKVYVVVQATFEAYKAIPLAIIAGVEVSVSVKIDLGLFSIRIHFSFKAQIREDLTIGTDRSTLAPWYGGDVQQLKSAQPIMAAMAIPVEKAVLNFNSIISKKKEDKPVLNIYFVPHLSISGEDSSMLSDQKATYISTLFMDSPDPDKPGQSSSFQYLCEEFFKWLINAYQTSGDTGLSEDEVNATAVTSEILNQITATLSDPDTPFPIETSRLVQFLSQSFSEVNVQEMAKTIDSATIFPMIPALKLSVPDLKLNYGFDDYVTCTTEYLSQVKTLFAELAVQVEKEMPVNSQLFAKAPPSQYYAMADFVFEDYFVMIGKQLLEHATEALKNFKYEISSETSIRAVLAWANALQEGAKSNDVNAESLFNANQNHPLTQNKPIQVCGVNVSVTDKDTFASVATNEAVSPAWLIIQNGTVPNVLRPNATVSYGGNSYQVRAGDSIEKIADELNTDINALAADEEFQNQMGLLNRGARLIVGAARYSVKNDDTFLKIAKVYAIEVADIITANQLTPAIFITGETFVYGDNKTYTFKSTDSVASVAENLKMTVAEIADSEAFQKVSLKPLAALLIPSFTHQTREFDQMAKADTFLKIASDYGITVTSLAAGYNNLNVTGIFYLSESTGQLNVPGLEVLDVNSCLNYFSQTKKYTSLSGMVARYQLHGMRLPVKNMPGIRFSKQATFCQDKEDCGLFNLTGQQFLLPDDVSEGFKIELINDRLEWLSFNGSKPDFATSQAVLPITLKTSDVSNIQKLTKFATDPGLIPDVTRLAPMKPYNNQPATYTFKSALQWTSSSSIDLPYGELGNQKEITPFIWTFPAGMENVLNLKHLVNPKFSIQIGVPNEAEGKILYKPSAYYGWGTIIDVDIKKIPVTSDNSFTYELVGAQANGITYLERLLRVIRPGNTGIVKDISILYSANKADGSGGVQSVGSGAMNSFIVQANLSTETNPPVVRAMALKSAEEKLSGLGNSVYDFVKLLWECSITGTGGFYIHYNELESNTGFPENVFNSDGVGQFRLLITYANGLENQLPNFMNCAITGDKIDIAKSLVMAQSEINETRYSTQKGDTLEAIVAHYNIKLSKLAKLNKDISLNTSGNVPLTMKQIIHVVGTPNDTPSNNITSLAAYFELDDGKREEFIASLKTLNPAVSNWESIPQWTLLKIPEIVYTLGKSDKSPGNTIETIASYFGISRDLLVFENKLVKDLFNVGTSLHVNDQVVHKIASIPQGTVGFKLDRNNPGVVPKPDDPDYAEKYLQNLYNLLGYQLVENEDFRASISGLPAGPARSSSQEELNQPDTEPEEGQPWFYDQVIPIAKYAKSSSTRVTLSNLPQESDNPYRGIGGTTQIHFSWRDLYGNKTITPFSNPVLFQKETKGPVIINNRGIKVGYIDQLLGISQWPGISVDYEFNRSATGSPQLQVSFYFSDKKYDGTTKTWQQDASNDLNIYESIYFQLNQINPATNENSVAITMETSLLEEQSNQISKEQREGLYTFINEIYQYLAKRKDGQEAKAPGQFILGKAIDQNEIVVRDILKLTVEIALKRDLSLVDEYFKDAQIVKESITKIVPKTVKTGAGGESDATGTSTADQVHQLTGFADTFESLFYQKDKVVLKIATGQEKDQSGLGNTPDIFVVRMGLKASESIYLGLPKAGTYLITSQGLSKMNTIPESIKAQLQELEGKIFENKETFTQQLDSTIGTENVAQYGNDIYLNSLQNPIFFAPTPLSTSLKSKSNVPICEYVEGTGIKWDNPVSKNFTGIDMDKWGKECLEAIDLLLTPDQSVPAFLVDQIKKNDGSSSKPALPRIVQAKKNLADAIKMQVQPILNAPAITEIDNPGNFEDAREKLKQHLLKKLSNLYTVTAIVQFNAKVSADFKASPGKNTPPKLYGAPVIAGAGQLSEDKRSYSLTTAKVPLKEQSSDAPSFLTFMFSAKNLAAHKDVDLSVSYQISHIEYDISQLEGIEGYEASNWLTFIIGPGSETDSPTTSVLVKPLGNIDIPVLLRVYPTPPSMVQQMGDPVVVSAKNPKQKLEEVSEWKYLYTYAQDHAAQDTIYSQIDFNVAPQMNKAMLAAAGRDLFNDLAQFVEVRKSIQTDLLQYLSKINSKSTAGDDVDKAYAALNAMAEISENLAQAWSDYNQMKGLMALAASFNSTKKYEFSVRETADHTFKDRLRITITPGDRKSNNTDGHPTLSVNDITVPSVGIKGYTKTAVIENKQEVPNAYWYYKDGKPTEFLTIAQAMNIANRQIGLDSLNVLEYQNAWAGISITRNENLIAGNPTNEAFIYVTPTVKFANKLVPLLKNGSNIQVASLYNDGKPQHKKLADHLINFFSIFLGKDGNKQQTIKLEAIYQYGVNESTKAPAIQLPVLLATPFSFQIPGDWKPANGICPVAYDKNSAFVCRLSHALISWFQKENPSKQQGLFKFKVSVFSDINDSQQPLIELRNVTLEIAFIEELQ